MLSSTLSIASANNSDVIPEETWKYLLLFHHIFGLRDVLTMYISFIENNTELNTSSVEEEPQTSSTGRLFFLLNWLYISGFTLFNTFKTKEVLVHSILN